MVWKNRKRKGKEEGKDLPLVDLIAIQGLTLLQHMSVHICDELAELTTRTAIAILHVYNKS